MSQNQRFFSTNTELCTYCVKLKSRIQSEKTISSHSSSSQANFYVIFADSSNKLINVFALKY